MSAPPRVVLDTNVVLSALVFRRGHVATIRRAWQDGRCAALVSSATAAELIRALGYPKFRLSSGEQEELLADYLPFCTVVRIPKRLPRVPACRDPCDLPFLQLARFGRADYLVTGDADLLSIRGELSCPIVEPSTFVNHLARSKT